MRRRARAIVAKRRSRTFENPEVDAVFAAYPEELREKLMVLRQLVFDIASATKGVGAVEETLKWGQPSYLTAETKSGSTICIDRVKSDRAQYAMYFHCQTNLVETFRELYPGEFSYGGNRCILFDVDGAIPQEALRHCVALALTYRLRKRRK